MSGIFKEVKECSVCGTSFELPSAGDVRLKLSWSDIALDFPWCCAACAQAVRETVQLRRKDQPNNYWRDLTGYVFAAGSDGCSGQHNLGLKIFVRMDRELTDTDKMALWKGRDAIAEALYAESYRLDPKEQESAAKERAAIVDLFPTPIFVEEVPNGYCSLHCCRQKPWFVVTTAVGRIRIGWRKSVIHLEWTDSAVNKTAAEIFPKEEAWPGYETTQYEKVIHAHGYDKAREYIARVINAGPEAKPW